jgi:hypothetical protein
MCSPNSCIHATAAPAQPPDQFLAVAQQMSRRDTLSSSVANIVRVATDARVLIDSPLDAIARASQTNVDAAMNVACSVGATVD